MIKRIIILFCLFFTILGSSVVNGQVVVERSTEKTIISGKQYYLHTVKKEETTYSISKAYNVTVEDITKLNPNAVYSIKVGEILLIPVVEGEAPKSTTVSRTSNAEKDTEKYDYHVLQSGETIYSLSRIYGVSESDILLANPSLVVTDISIGTEIAIPKKNFKTETQNFQREQPKYFFHKVKKGETLNSIAAYYGMALKDLRKENNNSRFVAEGDMIRIPSKYQKEVVAEVMPNIDTVFVDTTMVVYFDKPANLTSVNNLKGTLDVAVLLPFYLKENGSRYEVDSSRFVNGKRVYRTTSRSEDWIYSRSKGFIEMYEGILLAADTLRKLGLNINLHTYDVTNDTRQMTDIINQGKLKDMDLIIGPVYSSNLAIAAEYANTLNIPIVSPVQLMSSDVLHDNGTLFVANPFLHVSQEKIVDYISKFYDKNIVFVHGDTNETSPEINDFKIKLLSKLDEYIPYEDIRFKEFFFYNRSAFNNDSINRLGHALSSSLENVVVIASEDQSLISETLQDIHTLSKSNNTTVHVFGYPIIRGMENLDPKYLFELDLRVPSSYWIDYSARDVKAFLTNFYKKFSIEPEEMSYAWSGYDIAYFFMSGLAIHGKEFMEHPEIHNPDLLQTEFDFRHETLNDGFENNFSYIIRYSKDNIIMMEKNVNEN